MWGRKRDNLPQRHFSFPLIYEPSSQPAPRIQHHQLSFLEHRALGYCYFVNSNCSYFNTMACITVAAATLPSVPLDFAGNRDRILQSIKIAKEKGATIRTGPEVCFESLIFIE